MSQTTTTTKRSTPRQLRQRLRAATTAFFKASQASEALRAEIAAIGEEAGSSLRLATAACDGAHAFGRNDDMANHFASTAASFSTLVNSGDCELPPRLNPYTRCPSCSNNANNAPVGQYCIHCNNVVACSRPRCAVAENLTRACPHCNTVGSVSNANVFIYTACDTTDAATVTLPATQTTPVAPTKRDAPQPIRRKRQACRRLPTRPPYLCMHPGGTRPLFDIAGRGLIQETEVEVVAETESDDDIYATQETTGV